MAKNADKKTAVKVVKKSIRSEVIAIRVTEKQHANLGKIARKRGSTVSSMLYDWIQREAQNQNVTI